MLEAIHYQRHMLRRVIVRVDWLAEITEIRSILPRNISALVREHFPILEPKEVFRASVRVAPNTEQMVHQALEHYEWHFYTEGRANELTLTKDALFIDYKEYESFEELLRHFLPIADLIFRENENLQAKRLGIRYENHIRKDNGAPLSWEELINPSVLYPLNNLSDHARVLREKTTIDFGFEEFKLRFGFGIHNPDFPAEIRQRIYILDLDAYTQDVIEGNQIGHLLSAYHNKIQEFFEFSITDRLRELLDGRR